MPVLLRTDVDGGDVDESLVYQCGKSLLVLAQKKEFELSILLTDDATIKNINADWRKKDTATNVLSFPMNDDDPINPMLGDIIISMDTAKQEAAEKQHPLQAYIIRLLVHGFVHLLGYDHEESDEAFDTMRAMENTFLEKLSIDEPGM